MVVIIKAQFLKQSSVFLKETVLFYSNIIFFIVNGKNNLIIRRIKILFQNSKIFTNITLYDILHYLIKNWLKV